MKNVTAKEVIEKLGLAPLAFEGGFFKQTYKSKASGIPAIHFGIESASERKSSTAIYYLVTPESFSALHRVKSDEMFHFYCGDAVEMVQIDQEGKLSNFVLGSNIFEGQQPQVLVSKNVWQGLRLSKSGAWALMGTTVSPGYEDEDFELGIRSKLLSAYPQHYSVVEAYTREEA